MINPDLKELNERIDETKSKLNLLEGDEKAYYENAISTVTEAKRKILSLRRKNLNLRKELANFKQSDSKIIEKCFDSHLNEKLRYNNQDFDNVLVSMDNKTCDAMKKLNRLKYESSTKEQQLNDLMSSYQEKLEEIEAKNKSFKGISDEGKLLRDIENQLEKTKIKFQESEHIKKTYEKIKDKLISENLTYSKNLDNLESEMTKLKKLLEEIRCMYIDAKMARDNSVNDLKKTENMVFQQRKMREFELNSLKRLSEENIASHARQERNYEDNTEGKDRDYAMSEENYQNLKVYDENFMQIKEAIGVVSLEDAVAKFTEQIKKIDCLNKSNDEVEQKISDLTAIRDDLIKNLNEKTFADSQELNDQKVELENIEKETKEMESDHVQLLRKVSNEKNLYIHAKTGIERLFKLLKPIHLPEYDDNIIEDQKWHEDDEVTIFNVLKTISEKIVFLDKFLKDYNVDEKLDELCRDEAKELLRQQAFYDKIGEIKKVYDLKPKSDATVGEEILNDEPGVMSRVVLKKLSQALIDQKTRKKDMDVKHLKKK